MKFVKARWVFLAYLSGTVAFLAASITQRNQNGIGMSWGCFDRPSFLFEHAADTSSSYVVHDTFL